MSENLPDDLREWVEKELGVTAGEPVPIGEGASRAMWQVTDDLVVRVDTGTGPVAGTPLTLVREAAVYRALRDTGLPIPRLHAVSPDGRALVMTRVSGEHSLALAETAERQQAGRDYLHWLGRLHQLDVGALDLAGLGESHDLDLWTGIFHDRAEPYALAPTPFAIGWLRENAPSTPSATALCHGDAGPGNFLYERGKVTALLDWEFAHVGDPHDDLAWVAVRNHLLGRPMDIPDVYAAWSAVTGAAVDRGLVDYYRVFVLVRMAISCDATLAWKGGVEDDSIMTQVILRPWLATALVDALRFAGADGAELAPLAEAAGAAVAASPHAELIGLIPALEPVPV